MSKRNQRTPQEDEARQIDECIVEHRIERLRSLVWSRPPVNPDLRSAHAAAQMRGHFVLAIAANNTAQIHTFFNELLEYGARQTLDDSELDQLARTTRVLRFYEFDCALLTDLVVNHVLALDPPRRYPIPLLIDRGTDLVADGRLAEAEEVLQYCERALARGFDARLGDGIFPERKWQIEINSLMGEIAEHRDDLPAVILSLEKSAYHIECGDPWVEVCSVAQTFFRLGCAYAEAKRLDDAELQLRRAYKLTDAFCEHDHRACNLASIRRIQLLLLYDEGRYDEMLELCDQELELGEASHALASDLLNSRALAELKVGDAEKAKEIFLQLLSRAGDELEIALFNHNLGSAYLRLNELERAEHHNKLAQEQLRTAGLEDGSLFARSTYNQALVHLASNRYEDSLKLLNAAQSLLERVGKFPANYYVEILIARAEALKNLGRIESSSAELHRALYAAQPNLHLVLEVTKAHLLLAQSDSCVKAEIEKERKRISLLRTEQVDRARNRKPPHPSYFEKELDRRLSRKQRRRVEELDNTDENSRNELIAQLNEDGVSLSQIANRLGISHQRVSQIIKSRKKRNSKEAENAARIAEAEERERDFRSNPGRRPISATELSTRAKTKLRAAKINSVADLLKTDSAVLRAIKGIGSQTLEEIEQFKNSIQRQSTA
jgi:tetratricopeptide (TPR) repeat protein